jgi:DNA-3-methyladenine glycosylase II
LDPHDKILEHLKRDALLYEEIQKLDVRIQPDPSVDIYLELLGSIVSQQLSTKVVKVIWSRFTDLFKDGYPHAEMLLRIGHEDLRAIGLSNNKAQYVKNVARFQLESRMTFDDLQQKSDDEVIDYLTQIKGVGKWTVQMILMFPMDRPNVFPDGDLGIQNAMKRVYGLELEKKELLLKMNEIAAQWDPYKSLASKYLWKILEN